MGFCNISSSAFLVVGRWRHSSHPLVISERCPLRRLSSPQRGRLRTPCVLSTVSLTASSSRSDEAQYDDDDATMGEQGPVYGMTIPELTESDKDYLDGSSSNEDFMKRMTEIARRIDRERKIALRKANTQDAEKYLESLSRPSAPIIDGGPPRVNAGDQYMANLSKTPRKSRVIESPSLPVERGNLSMEPGPVGNFNDPVRPETLESVEDRISKLQDELESVGEGIDANATFEDAVELQEAIRKDMGFEGPQPTQGPEPKTIDKQIDFLESYLEKLKQEEEEEEEEENLSGSEDDKNKELLGAESVENEIELTARKLEEKFTPQFEGLQDTPGGMTAAEKMAAFDQLRRQAKNLKAQEPNMLDPYNITLPSGKNDDGEEPSPDSEQEYDQLGGAMNKKLLVEEVEAEIARYTTEAKKLLHKHDARMQVLLARLRAL